MSASKYWIETEGESVRGREGISHWSKTRLKCCQWSQATLLEWHLTLGDLNSRLSRRPPKVYVIRRTFVCGIEKCSTDNAYGSENVTLKMNSLFFSNFSAFIPVRLKLSKVGEFPWSWFLGTALKFRKTKKNSSSLVYASIQREIMHFHVLWKRKQDGRRYRLVVSKDQRYKNRGTGS